MTDPVRLSNDPDMPSELRRALRSERRRAPPRGLEAAVRAVVVSQLAQTAAAAAAVTAAKTAGAGTTAVAATSSSALAVASVATLKAFVVGVGLGGVAIGASALVSATEPTASSRVEPAKHALDIARSGELTARSRGAPPVRSASHDAPPGVDSRPAEETARAPAAPKASAAAPAELLAANSGALTPLDVSVVGREAARVAEARELVRRGLAADALDSLAALDTDAQSGVLVQERESLRIEALMALGRAAEAARAARRFLDRHPESPHATRVRSWLRQAANPAATR